MTDTRTVMQCDFGPFSVVLTIEDHGRADDSNDGTDDQTGTEPGRHGGAEPTGRHARAAR